MRTSLRGRVFALLYEPLLAPAEKKGMRALRRELLSDASGRTLELGAGTGLNLGLYPDTVTSLTVTEPEPAMVRRLRARAAHDGGAEVVRAPGEDLPFADASFDTVVCTMVLCTVADLAATLREIDRVLAPEGCLLVIEHVRASDAHARRQDRWHGPWRAFAAGCHCNLDTIGALTTAGFDTAALRATQWRGMPSLVRPLVAGHLSRLPHRPAGRTLEVCRGGA